MTLVFGQPDEMRAWSQEQHRLGRTIALVPTMGALHDGHLALIRSARAAADVTVTSIFVNPLQFNRPADFDSYPRPIDADVALCTSIGVDAVYAPTAATMYPGAFQTAVEPGALAERLEGRSRPGHFRGVTTVVVKLFGAVQPDVAVFGRKDFQQLAVIRQMTSDLDLGVEIFAHPIVREPDGLAMSSRNARLDPASRLAAPCLHEGLMHAAEAHRRGERSPERLTQLVEDRLAAEPLANTEYVDLVDARSLVPMVEAPLGTDEFAIVVAVWFGDVRLIDNLQLDIRADDDS